MTVTTQMLDSHPDELDHIDRARLEACVAACFECAQVCTACADACLAEETVADLTTCIRTNLDCADVCGTTGRVLSRQTGYDVRLARAVLEACMQVCHSCAEACHEHADMHEHCKVCRESCRTCEQACRDLLESLG